MQIESLLVVYWLDGKLSGKHLFSVISKINYKIGLTASPGFACSPEYVSEVNVSQNGVEN